jgi:Domain of unknown function (DUF5134)
MTGPSLLAAASAALMLLIAASCAARLAVWRLRGRGTEPGSDGLHVLMGVTMAGMLEPHLSPVPAVVWQGVFGAAAAWFAWLAISARMRRRRSSSWCAHPAPHAVECAAMIYMLLPAGPAGHARPMAMPGMSGGSIAARNPALALVLALFMLGYILWTTDQLTALSRSGTAATSIGTAAKTSRSPTSPGLALVSQRTLGPAAARRPRATAALAPRFAACYKLVMSIAMAYMLITMV